MKFQIADTIVEMVSMHHLIDMPLYSNFTMPDNTPTDIKIEILDAIECSYHIDKKISICYTVKKARQGDFP